MVFHSEMLNIFDFVDKEFGYEGNTSYYLYGVINHKGSLSSGHYYSYVKFSKESYLGKKIFNDMNREKPLFLPNIKSQNLISHKKIHFHKERAAINK